MPHTIGRLTGKEKNQNAISRSYISCRGINWELGFRFSDQVKLLGCDQVARCAKHVCKIAKLVCVRCFVWNPRGSDIYMMGEGLRCRHIRSKPAELGQKVGNKSDKARGGGMVEPLVHGGPQRHYRHHRHQQERLSTVVECATVNTGWCTTLKFGGPMLRLYI